MIKYEIVSLKDNPEYKEQMVQWFSSKWEIPQAEYEASMDMCLKKAGAFPQWYIVICNENIIGGLGVIENDFHDRKDLTPNVCAVYVEEKYRKQGIARLMLQYVCDDMEKLGVPILYLVTEHKSFYERCGWEYMCEVKCDNESDLLRMYIHRKK